MLRSLHVQQVLNVRLQQVAYGQFQWPQQNSTTSDKAVLLFEAQGYPQVSSMTTDGQAITFWCRRCRCCFSS